MLLWKNKRNKKRSFLDTFDDDYTKSKSTLNRCFAAIENQIKLIRYKKINEKLYIRWFSSAVW